LGFPGLRARLLFSRRISGAGDGPLRQNKAIDEKNHPYIPGHHVFFPARGHLAGVEADPRRARAAVTFGTAAPVDATIGIGDNYVVVHPDLSWLEVEGFELMKGPSWVFLMPYLPRASFIP
jgi:hypothetical protein